jgi:hypothetical protein
MTKTLRLGLRTLPLICLAAAIVSGFSAFAQEQASVLKPCQLDSAGDKIKHVVEIIFDNVHLRRDNPNVPSDLEQMPNLLNFIRQKGTLDANHHPVLISHTADDELTFLTGVYGDRHGIPVANSYGVFLPNGSITFAFSFFYWTNLVSDQASPPSPDSTSGMLSETGKNAPAPWVPFTRAGCDVGTFSNANLVIETTSVDVPRIFGPNSSEAKETGDQQFLDFEGAAVHCAKGSSLCSTNNHGAPDVLPQEPGGYNGFNALYGFKYMNLALGAIKDLDGNPITGFPGFSPTASQSLGVVLAMQQAGIPVTLAYITDLHDSQTSDNSFGPGEAGYVGQIKSYDAAFGKFFAQLKSHGIDESNTLFIITADEGDHFVGGPPSPAGCDGVHTACTYSQIGSLDVNLNALVPAETGNNTPFSIKFDMAPAVYIQGQPGRTAANARELERDFAKLTALNPFTKQNDHLAVALADPVEMGLLHMVTADPARTPSFTMFGAPDYWFVSFGSAAPTADPTAAWNHGGIQSDIGTLWLGMVGPGVRRNTGGEGSGGSDENGTGAAIDFSDHTDVRPTVLALVGLQDDYAHDGRVLFEALDPSALPESLRDHFDTLLSLGRIYKQINAPFGDLGLTSLKVSTFALASSSSGDATYTKLENKIATWRTQRDLLAGQMRATLDAALNNETISDDQVEKLIEQGQALLDQVKACAAAMAQCAL